MAKRRSSRRALREQELREHHFTPLEARMLRELPRKNQARATMIATRDARWERFTKIAQRKVDRGQWRRQDVMDKWAANLSRFYSRNHLRVKFGPTGGQTKLPRGSPNPWALYRHYERQYGGPRGKPYVSPWQLRQLRTGKTPLQKGLIFVQGAERRLQDGTVSKAMVRSWVEQKGEAIKKARGKHRAQLVIEKRRLERLL